MKKIFFISLLSIIQFTFSRTSQAQTDSLTIKKDTTIVSDTVTTQVFPNSSKIKDKKTKKELKAEADTADVSYAEEFKKSKLRVTWGLRGGVNIGQFLVNEIGPIRVQPNGLPILGSNNRVIRDRVLANQQSGIGYVGGLFMRVTRGSFYFQPEAMYSIKSGKFDILQDDGSLFKRVNVAITTVDIPIMFGIRFRQGRVFVGPNVSFPFKMNNEMTNAVKLYMDEERINNIKSEFLQRPALNFQGGLGFEFQHILLDIRYELGLSNISNATLGISSQPSSFIFKQNLLQLTLGLVK